MSGFDTNFLFLDRPDGGVEDIQYLKEKCPWIKGVFCNVHSHDADEWNVVRDRCKQHGLFCGPWARVAKGDPNNPEFDPTLVDKVVAIADLWVSRGIVNCEKEIDGHQDALDYIVSVVGRRDFALSVQPIPFADLDWSVARQYPVLVQIMPVDQGNIVHDPEVLKRLWWSRGIDCVFATYGVFGGMKPDLFTLKASYSLFTGDPIMASYTVEKWAPTSSGYIACKPQEAPKVVGVTRSISDAYTQILQSNPAKVWREANPGELEKITTYWNASPGTPPPEGVTTKFGLGLVALIEARRYAEGSHN